MYAHGANMPEASKSYGTLNSLKLSKRVIFFLQISTNVLQVTSVTAVRLVIIQMDPTLAHVTAASRGMDEPVEVQAFE